MLNQSELAQKMLEWERLTIAANAIAAEIEAAVLAIGKTQTVGNVRASFATGRKSYDYETPARRWADEQMIAAFTETKVITNWRGICKVLNIKPVTTGQNEPSVSVKLLV